jgi:hypothetical protein
VGRPGKRSRGRPRRGQQVALFARFYADLFELMIQWAELAETEIQAWPRTDGLGQ